MNVSKSYIIIGDDDVSLSTVLSDYLSHAGYVVETASDGARTMEAIRSGRYDLCLLDITMPKGTGYEVLRELRSSGNTMPVIMLSARTAREDIIRAFELGCDDYVTKPFSMDILICRIEAVLRRCRTARESQATEFDLAGKCFDSVRQTLDGAHLSARESDLLLMLCRRMNTVVDRHAILWALWQTDDIFASRSLSVYINRLRTHLEGTGIQIVGVHGKGYKLITNATNQ